MKPLLGVMDRYLGRTVLVAMLVVLVAFLGLMTLFSLVDELRGNDAGYTFLEAFEYVALTTPRRLVEVLPYVVFLGVLIGMGNLANHSELVVLRAAGVSAYRMFLSVTWPAAGVLVAGLLIGELVAPRGEELAEAHKTRSKRDSDVIMLRGGYWYREGPLYMHLDGIGAEGELLGLKQFWLAPDKSLTRARTASAAEFMAGADPHWMLSDVVETEFRSDGTHVRKLPSLRWDAHADPRLLSVRVLVEPRKLSVVDLDYQIDYMRREGLNPDGYELAFWAKLFQPLSVLGLALLALGFVLGPLRQVGMGLRLSVGVLAGLTFKYLQDLFAPMSLVYEIPAAVAVAVPIAVCWGVAYVGLKKLT